MPRYRLSIEYDGSPFSGWQRQDDVPSVQQAIEEAIQAFSHEAVCVYGGGRTDRGVHARGQVAHVDLSRPWRVGTIRDALNAYLREVPIVIHEATEVDASFDARRSATGRSYCYRILNRRAPAALDRMRAWHVPKPMDAAAMHTAAQNLLGQHDFTTFRSSECQALSPVKTLRRLDVIRQGEDVFVWAEARSFLHKQVRSLVGSLVQVGVGRWSEQDLIRALEAKNRAACGPLAPPHGLTLESITYPEATGL